jgi:PAS domain S-box-containing protein
MDRPPLHNLDADAALRTILEGTATETGAEFFKALVRKLAEALHTQGAWVTEYIADSRRLKALAFWMGGQWLDGWEMVVDGTPCERVINERCLIHIPDNLVELYGEDPDVRTAGAVSYMGMPLLDSDDKILGHLAILDTRPMPAEPRAQALFQIFAARAAAELRRLRVEAQVREREQKLGRLVGSAMDAIIEIDQHWRVTQMNPAAEKIFDCGAMDAAGQIFTHFLAPDSREKLARLIIDLDSRPDGQRFLWIPGGLTATGVRGAAFQAEATLSRFDVERAPFYTLILRNVSDRLETEQKIRALAGEAEYLREEISALVGVDEIIGRSEPLCRVLADVGEVAATDATVLILGETGTGKELIARAVHLASRRREKPLIKVNCAAIPATLIESEFFGHEQGAFTGATKKRDGRFALAHGGTIFLDEVGELLPETQVALLRVLQERQFERVGGTQSIAIDVRVIAATNRDLKAAVAKGHFREDLFYRLNVFPIDVPPLRKRKDDVLMLVEYFVRRYASRAGKTIRSIDKKTLDLLQAYDWPGNIRELQNVIERSVILCSEIFAVDESWLPTPSVRRPDQAISFVLSPGEPRGEREIIEAALAACRGRVAGPSGAAAKLGVPPSTLDHRIRALNINKTQFKFR